MCESGIRYDVQVFGLRGWCEYLPGREVLWSMQIEQGGQEIRHELLGLRCLSGIHMEMPRGQLGFVNGLEVCFGELLESGVSSREITLDASMGRKEGLRLSLGILQCLEVGEEPTEQA